MIKDKKLTQRLEGIAKRYGLQHPNENITITFTRDEWYHIWEDARNDRGFTNQDTDVILKLYDLISEKSKKGE